MNKGDELNLTIESLSTEGKGIARTEEGFVVFVEKALPGDNALVQIRKKKSSYAEARIVELISPSEFRVEPRCNYFGICGGCKVQNYEYSKQLEFKTQSVKDAFRKIGGFGDLEIPPTIGSDRIFFYRNKMEFSFSDDKWVDDPNDDSLNEAENKFALGLHVPKFHSKIVDIQECFLQSEVSNEILNFTRDFFKSKNETIYSTSTHTGFLRFLVIRQSTNTSDLMVNLITLEHDPELMNEFKNEILKAFPQITTLINSTTASKAQVAFAQSQHVLFGSGYIMEKLVDSDHNEFVFKISPNSFFQTNTLQTNTLFSVAKEFGKFSKNDKVLDLYCGAGSISIFISSSVEKVTGVELVEDAINNAKENMKSNKIENADFISSDIKDYLNSHEIKSYNKIILDPPRSGLHPEISEELSNCGVDIIVYVSCNPSTQARDIQTICSKGNFRIEKIQPVDMFPHTYHVENVVSLARTESI